MSQNVTIYIAKGYSETLYSRLQYTIAAINNHRVTQAFEVHFTLSSEKGEIAYGEGACKVSIPCQDEIYLNSKKQFFINEYKWNSRSLYSVETTKKKHAKFYENNNFAFDVFETIFFHLSRYEEILLKQSNYLGNKIDFENQLLLVKNHLEKIPVVDQLIQAFLEAVTGKKKELKKPIHLSHDIDFIQKFKSPLSIFRKIAGHIRHRKSVQGLSYLWQSYRKYLLSNEDSFNTFEWMLSTKEYNKTIYLLRGGQHTEDNHYQIENPIVQKALKLAKERAYKIGIHPSYESWNNVELMRSQKEKLENEVGEEILLSRQHFLNFDIEVTPKLLHSIGIKEDSSLGYTRYVGYRCGTGFPYKLYDFENEKELDVVEVPLVFMDVAWLFEALRTKNMSLPRFSNLYGSFNFHNSTFDEMKVRGIEMEAHYKKHF